MNRLLKLQKLNFMQHRLGLLINNLSLSLPYKQHEVCINLLSCSLSARLHIEQSLQIASLLNLKSRMHLNTLLVITYKYFCHLSFEL